MLAYYNFTKQTQVHWVIAIVTEFAQNISFNLHTSSQMRLSLVNCQQSSLSFSRIALSWYRVHDTVWFLGQRVSQLVSANQQPPHQPKICLNYYHFTCMQVHRCVCHSFDERVRYLSVGQRSQIHRAHDIVWFLEQAVHITIWSSPDINPVVYTTCGIAHVYQSCVFKMACSDCQWTEAVC